MQYIHPPKRLVTIFFIFRHAVTIQKKKTTLLHTSRVVCLISVDFLCFYGCLKLRM